MKKAMFRYKMSLAGYSDHDIERIEGWLDSRMPVCISEERAAICEYAKLNVDASKIPMYINTVTHMYLNSGLEFHVPDYESMQDQKLCLQDVCHDIFQ